MARHGTDVHREIQLQATEGAEHHDGGSGQHEQHAALLRALSGPDMPDGLLAHNKADPQELHHSPQQSRPEQALGAASMASMLPSLLPSVP